MKKTLIFNDGKPMYSPSLKPVNNYLPATEQEKMDALTEIELMNSARHFTVDASCDIYKEVAMLYASVYDEKIAMSNLLLAFQGAVVHMQSELNKHVREKGETSKTIATTKRNQLFMRVHREASALIERNNQVTLMLKNALDKYAELNRRFEKLKTENEAMKKAFESE